MKNVANGSRQSGRYNLRELSTRIAKKPIQVVQKMCKVIKNKDWVSGTSVKNYLLKDPLLDWFCLHHNKSSNVNTKKVNDDSHLSFLFEMGNKFENEVTGHLRKIYPSHTRCVVENKSPPQSKMMDITKQYIVEGVPIIEQAALYNYKNKTFGVADLLVRSDWINKIFSNKIISSERETLKAPQLNGDYHYIVIDIKWTTMQLCVDGRHIRNSGMFPAYKGQLAIYNAALGNIQGMTSPEAFILAKAWTIDGKTNSYNCFDTLGCVNYEGFDIEYLDKTTQAIDWVRNVRANGHNWSCYEPHIPEMYPNMCNRYDTPYHGLKKEVAEEINELTQIWMVGIKNRNIAHTKGIYKWSDKRCNSKMLGINGKKIGPIVDKIIKINREGKQLMTPKKIKNNLYNWKHETLEFFVDFEAANGCFYDTDIDLEDSKKDSNLIFMIGVGFVENGKWTYKAFVSECLNLEEEFRIVDNFTNFITSKIDDKRIKPNLYHWGHAEKTIFNAVNRRHNDHWKRWLNKIEWADFYQVFVSEPIAIKGAKKYNLKEVASAMHANGMIESCWNTDGPTDGLAAMMCAIDYYKFMQHGNISNKTEYELHNRNLNIVIDYNEIDCKVIYEIIKYFRINSC